MRSQCAFCFLSLLVVEIGEIEGGRTPGFLTLESKLNLLFMPSLSFKKQFAEPILSGTKKQTIRKFRKYPIMQGQTLYLYTGLRTKYATKLKEVTCKATCKIRITSKSVTRYNFIDTSGKYYASKKIGSKADLDCFARKDGFVDFADMKAFWIAEHGKEGSPFPFTGTLITWL